MTIRAIASVSTALDSAIGLNDTNSASLVMLFTEQDTLVEILCRRRDINRRVPVEEIDGLERYLEDLARHDWEVFDAGNLCLSVRCAAFGKDCKEVLRG